MKIDLHNLPEWAKLEISKADLLAFAEQLLLQNNENQTAADLPEILDIDEAADFLRLARQTLYGYTCKRVIPFYKRNKRLYFKRSELLIWMEEGRKETQQEVNGELKTYLQSNQSGI